MSRPAAPGLKRRDFTPAVALRRRTGPARILMAINGKVFDVTKGRSSTAWYGQASGAAKTKEGAPAPGWVLETRGGSGAPGEGLEWCPGLGGRGRRPPGGQGARRHLWKGCEPVGSQIPSPHSRPPGGGGRRLKCLSWG